MDNSKEHLMSCMQLCLAEILDLNPENVPGLKPNFDKENLFSLIETLEVFVSRYGYVLDGIGVYTGSSGPDEILATLHRMPTLNEFICAIVQEPTHRLLTTVLINKSGYVISDPKSDTLGNNVVEDGSLRYCLMLDRTNELKVTKEKRKSLKERGYTHLSVLKDYLLMPDISNHIYPVTYNKDTDEFEQGLCILDPAECHHLEAL